MHDTATLLAARELEPRSYVRSFTVQFIARLSVVLADLFVIILTWRKTYCQWRSSVSLNMKVTASECLIKNGE